LVYKKWLLEKIFEIHSKDSVVIMVLPIEDGLPNYRDAAPPYVNAQIEGFHANPNYSPFTLISGYSPLNLSPIVGAPEVTAPGEISSFVYSLLEISDLDGICC
jgi:hypothetical protein